MTTESTTDSPQPEAGETFWIEGGNSDTTLGQVFRTVLSYFASLKLTVALFAMAIFIVLIGTLAQAYDDIWVVVNQYFRVPMWPTLGFAWVEFQHFLPPAFFPSKPQIPGGFYFPGGWLIGGMMAINLISAHLIRFRVQAKGTRLIVGLGVIASGAMLTWLAISSGSSKDGIQEAMFENWDMLWNMFRIGILCLLGGFGYGFVKIDNSRNFERGLLGVFALITASLAGWVYFGGEAARIGDSGMRIVWQLSKGTGGGLALLTGCIMVFKKRAGVVLLHSGIGLMMLSELLVGTLAVEGQMHIAEGETVNYVQDIRTLELAVIDHTDPDNDAVVVIPESILLGGRVISDDSLPFQIEVTKFLKNSDLKRVNDQDENLADRGAGLTWVVEEVKAGTGTSGSEVDISSAYVKILSKDGSKELGTHLLSMFLKDEAVTVGEKTYDVALRFKRDYKSYSMNLIDVRKDDYAGTSMARNYSSEVRLFDPTRDEDRVVRIWMNNPLRFAGETFYQSSYNRDQSTGKETTGLAVVSNTGWMIPYVSCMIVAIGMLAHFWGILVRFLNRRSSSKSGILEASSNDDDDELTYDQSGKIWEWVIPAFIVLLFVGYVGSKARVPKPSTTSMDLYRFGQIPVEYEGRIKPLDTLARNALLVLSEKETFVDDNDKKQPAIQWLVDAIAKPEVAFDHPVFRITDLELLESLDLKPRSGYRYAFSEFGIKLGEIGKQADQAKNVEAENRTRYQNKVLELEQKIGLYDLIIQAFSAPNIRQETAREDLMQAIGRQQALTQRHPPLVVPPEEIEEANPEDESPPWTTFAEAWTRNLVKTAIGNQPGDPNIESLTEILVAYAQDDAKKFNSEVKTYEKRLAKNPPAGFNSEKGSFETFFNRFNAFGISKVFYIIAFVLAGCSWMGYNKVFTRSSFWLVVAVFALHTFALICRIYISGRPPVTNLYSSAVFIGWGTVLLGILLELAFKIGIGNVVASVTGYASLLVAYYLGLDGETITVLEAVLDTQFWLATHVTCIALGYSTTFLTGFLGVVYILMGLLTPKVTKPMEKSLNRMIYGTLCFAIFFSFVGTVLGGLWADDSWGRFWGWDPKENGALIIVLWNALVLHARWGALVKNRGLAVLVVVGNIVTGWSWFGVNELGVGLHSYGFTEGVLFTLGLFVMGQVAIIGLGCIPESEWWSYKRRTEIG